MRLLLLLLSVFAIITLSAGVANAYHNSLLESNCDDVQDKITHVACSDVQYLYSIMLGQQNQLDVINDTLNSIILEQENGTDIINATISDVIIRINELTIYHYPDDDGASLTPYIPEIVPLPEYPTAGENPEIAPNAPEIRDVESAWRELKVNWYTNEEEIDDRYEDYSFNVVEISTDGIEWNTVYDSISHGASNYFNYEDIDNYVEYLVRVYSYNDFGNSTKSLIWSGIPTEFIDNTYIYFLEINSSYIYVVWQDVDTFTHETLYWILERSVNYGEFEVIDGSLGIEIDGNGELEGNGYADYDVTSGNIYSYRVSLVTDFETQTRSGFASALVP